MRILCFGDSITQGYWDSRGGWVNRIRAEYDELFISAQDNDPPVVFNLGISGETTTGLLKRFKYEVEARKFPGEEFVIVIATGTNDTLYRGSDNESEPGRYQQQITELVRQAREFTSKILLVGLFPVVDEMVQPLVGSSSGKCYSTERMKLFDKALKDVAQQNNVPVVDVWFPFFSVAANLEDFLIDGIHPSDQGHELIASLVKPHLDKLIA